MKTISIKNNTLSYRVEDKAVRYVEVNGKSSYNSGGFRDVFVFDEIVVKFDSSALQLGKITGFNQTSCEALMYEKIKEEHPEYVGMLVEPLYYKLATNTEPGVLVQPKINIDKDLFYQARKELPLFYQAFREATKKTKIDFDISFDFFNNLAYTHDRGFVTYDYGNFDVTDIELSYYMEKRLLENCVNA